MILLDEPNVLILDEPSNDLDTDMLAAMEEFLDTWPGTLLVVSHDRYLMERVTDQQYALVNGTFSHLPGGVDQYLQLSAQAATAPSSAAADSSPLVSRTLLPLRPQRLAVLKHRVAQKEINQIDRKLGKLADQKDALAQKMLAHDQTDYVGLAELGAQQQSLQDEIEELEMRWMELSEILDS